MTTDFDRVVDLERELLRDRFIDFERSVLQENIALCDTKAGLLLAFTGGLVVFCIDAFVTLKLEPTSYLRVLAPIIKGLLMIAAIGFLASAQFSLITVLPRIRRGRVDHVFWEAPIFKLPLEGYVEAMEALLVHEERTDKLGHLHLLAGICRNKYRHFQASMRLAQVAFVALIARELLRAAA